MTIDTNMYLLDDVKQTFARLFVIATNRLMNPYAFTSYLADSNYIRKLEEGNIDEISNIPVSNAFFDITNESINEDSSYGIYNDAYWCGHCYFELFLQTHKPFSYLFLKRVRRL